MTATVEQIQNDPARLIRLAIGGEEVVITEAGQPVAKLIAFSQQNPESDRAQWLESLRRLRELTSTGKPGKSSDDILNEDRTGHSKPVLIRCFQKTPLVLVRTLDAMHLASAVVAGEIEFVATDKRLRDAALALGFKLFP